MATPAAKLILYRHRRQVAGWSSMAIIPIPAAPFWASTIPAAVLPLRSVWEAILPSAPARLRTSCCPEQARRLCNRLGGDRTLANAFDLDGGLTFQGSNSITFTGPFNIIQPQDGGIAYAAERPHGKDGYVRCLPWFLLHYPRQPSGERWRRPGQNCWSFPATSEPTRQRLSTMCYKDPAPGGGTASGSVQYGTTGSGNTAVLDDQQPEHLLGHHDP